MNQVATLPKRSLVDSMAARYEMEPSAFVNAIKATVIKGQCSNEQFAAFLMVAKEYDLNPLTKEIYAFPDRGGITPIVSIDGWMNLINSHPQFDGMEFVDSMGDDGKLYSVECKMYRKDRQRPTTVIEYMSECYRQTDPWKKWPNRMLRHKAAIQCARYAFGFSGIMEPDEYERMKDVTPIQSGPVFDPLSDEPVAPQRATDEREGFNASPAAEERSDALTGEILDNTDTDETAPASSVDAGMTPADEAGAESPSDAPASELPNDVRNHFIDFARKALKTAGDDQLTAEQRKSAIDDMVLNYRDVIPESLWSKLSGVHMPIQYVLVGKRTIDQARGYIAKDLLDCNLSDLGGVDG